MPNHSIILLAAAAASLAGLTSCDPPLPPPPPRFTPNPPFSPQPIQPGEANYDVSPPTTPPPAPVTPPGTYPVARATENPDQVISPYEPYNVIDISGPPRIQSDKLAKDPSNLKIFQVP